MPFTFIALHYLPNAPWLVELCRHLPDKKDTADVAVSQGATK